LKYLRLCITAAVLLAFSIAAVLQAQSPVGAATDLTPDLTTPAGGFAPTDQTHAGPAPSPFASNPDDVYWDNRFTMTGVDQGVLAIAVSNSEVYAGGYFRVAGSVIANGIAKWNRVTSTWVPLGNGTNGVVDAIAISGTNVYVGGSFTSTGTANTSYIAKWNGSSWSSLGSGVDGSVYSIALSGNNVYAGGVFSHAGGISASGIARWNGSVWSTLGTGVNADVFGISISGTKVYATGNFTMAGGISANRFAIWNGSTWSTLGVGLPGTGHSLVVKGSEIFVADQYYGVQMWDGSTWSQILGGGYPNYPAVVVLKDNQVIEGGSRLLHWDGTTWQNYGGYFDSGNSLALSVSGNDVFVGGILEIVHGYSGQSILASNIAIYNEPANSWSALGPVPQRGVELYGDAIAVNGSDTYVSGGSFVVAGARTGGIVNWNGSNWSSVGTDIGGNVWAIAVSNTTVYAGADFPNRVAMLNGGNWTTLGSDMDGQVLAIVVSSTEVYAGGYFIMAGATTVNRIARWDGANWSPLGSGMTAPVRALVISGTDIYAGGSFTMAGGVAANRIARWDGNTWSPLGGGVNGTVRALAVFGGKIYAGGTFTAAGGYAINYIAKWDGSNWSAVGGGLSGDPSLAVVYSLVPNGSDLYVGGSFDSAGGHGANNIARWDGSQWNQLGSGVTAANVNGLYVFAIAVEGDNVFVGGSFSVAGDKPSVNFARWSKPTLHPLLYLPLILR
jgi:hypothetical protein